MPLTQAVRNASCFLVLILTSIGCGDGTSDANSTPAPGRAASGGSGPRLDVCFQRQFRLVERRREGHESMAPRSSAPRSRCDAIMPAIPPVKSRFSRTCSSLPDVQGVAISVLEAESRRHRG